MITTIMFAKRATECERNKQHALTLICITLFQGLSNCKPQDVLFCSHKCTHAAVCASQQLKKLRNKLKQKPVIVTRSVGFSFVPYQFPDQSKVQISSYKDLNGLGTHNQKISSTLSLHHDPGLIITALYRVRPLVHLRVQS